MMLEAVWFKNGKEVYQVAPVMNIVCEDDMNNVNEIEINDGYEWISPESFGFEADDFIIRIMGG